jgi:plastocyanin
MNRVTALGLASVAIVASMGAPPASPAPVSAAVPAVVTGPGSIYYGYLPPVLVVEKGAALTYANFDSTEHDFVHDAEADGFGGPKKAPWCRKMPAGSGGHHHAHGCPVFFTPLLGTGETAEVKGLQNLEPGTTYTFVCTKHHNMTGTLIAR